MNKTNNGWAGVPIHFWFGFLVYRRKWNLAGQGKGQVHRTRTPDSKSTMTTIDENETECCGCGELTKEGTGGCNACCDECHCCNECGKRFEIQPCCLHAFGKHECPCNNRYVHRLASEFTNFT